MGSGRPSPLVEAGVKRAFHYAPLHYLPFILRSGELRSKVCLTSNGYSESHFRSTSAKQDKQRGFSGYVHGSLDAHPPILRAKLSRGFPHFEISLPVSAIENEHYLLCRFNIAKTRYFRGAKQEPMESAENGRYFGKLLVPVARTEEEKRALLKLNLGVRMIEVLIEHRLVLPPDANITVFSNDDFEVAQELVDSISTLPLAVAIDRSLNYPTKRKVREDVLNAIDLAVKDSDWKGNGLEFDRV